jgi:hypothetical protein
VVIGLAPSAVLRRVESLGISIIPIKILLARLEWEHSTRGVLPKIVPHRPMAGRTGILVKWIVQHAGSRRK